MYLGWLFFLLLYLLILLFLTLVRNYDDPTRIKPVRRSETSGNWRDREDIIKGGGDGTTDATASNNNVRTNNWRGNSSSLLVHF